MFIKLYHDDNCFINLFLLGYTLVPISKVAGDIKLWKNDLSEIDMLLYITLNIRAFIAKNKNCSLHIW